MGTQEPDSRIDPEADALIRLLFKLRNDLGATEVYRLVEARIRERDGNTDKVPSIKTVRRRHERLRQELAGEDFQPWTVLDGDGEYVLPTLRLGFGIPSRSHARYIAAARRACPSLGDSDEHLEWAWVLGLGLMDGANLAFTTLQMAHEPWTPEGWDRWAAYLRQFWPKEWRTTEDARAAMKRALREMTPEKWAEDRKVER